MSLVVYDSFRYTLNLKLSCYLWARGARFKMATNTNVLMPVSLDILYVKQRVFLINIQRLHYLLLRITKQMYVYLFKLHNSRCHV